VARITVVSRPDWRDQLPSALDGRTEVIYSTDDPLIVANATIGDSDGVVFCSLEQLFVDPVRLDTLAAQPLEADSARLLPVLSSEPSLALTGGAFVQILTREGLEAAITGRDVALPATRWLTWPEPRGMRLRSNDDFEWAAAVYELALQASAAAGDPEFNRVLTEHGCARGPLWDGIGARPRSLLTVRALREPMFSDWVQYLARFCPAGVDVVCPLSLRDATTAMAGVSRVWTFSAPRFSAAVLSADQKRQIAAREYDVCVLPRLEPSGHGYDNLLPLAEIARSRVAMWVDAFGGSGIVSGSASSWDGDVMDSPFSVPHAIEAWAQDALGRFSGHRARPARRAPTSLALGA
jgi:hypothetical protein